MSADRSATETNTGMDWQPSSGATAREMLVTLLSLAVLVIGLTLLVTLNMVVRLSALA